MFRQRAPWPIYVVAASYLVSAAVVLYVEFRGPQDPGIEFESFLAPSPATVRGILPGSPAERAGIDAGDRLTSFESRPIVSTLDWIYALGNAQAGRPLRVGIERRGESRHVFLTLGQKTGVPQDVTVWVRMARALLALSLAILIAYSRPFDLQARIGALLLAEVGLFGLFFLNAHIPGMSAIESNLPLPLQVLVEAPLLSPGGALLFAFAAIFPRPFFRGWRAWALVWVPLLATMGIRGYYHIYLRPELVRIPGWVKSVGALYFIGAVVVFVLNYKRLEDRNERRRAKVVAIGTVALIVAVLPYVFMLSAGAPVAALESFFFSPGVFVSLNLLTAAFPISIAYAVLRHRAFDIAVVIRQGLKYAVARRTLVAVLPFLAAILVGDLLMHSDQTLGATLRERGWIYAGLGALAILAQRRQRDWLEALDRKFFRERYDAQRLLREVAEQVRQAASFEKAALSVAAQVESALHNEFTAVLMRRPEEASYSVVAVAPTSAPLPALPGHSRLLALIRLLGKPMEITLTEMGWLKQLPEWETKLLREARIEWLIPIAIVPERVEALLALGLKRSEEPYTREDQDLLIAIAASLSLLLERPATLGPAPVETFEECPRCGSLYSRGAVRCSREGATLTPVHLPRILADRYRLERRLGAGGMGTVYEATDTALERRIAAKVMRDELAGSVTAAERFRREARAAAAFSHLNVVTIHDFGVAAGNRAFLVMELLDGVDLRTELKQKHRLPPSRVLEVLRGVCAALEAAHEIGLMHRDIKPENIFLARRAGIEIPKVLDFGLAKWVSLSIAATQTMSGTGGGQLVGTLRYMSPEQLRGDPPGASWDLWALGVVAYEMLTGDYPFAAATPVAWQMAVAAGRFTPLASLSWQEFFSRTLAVEQQKRPPAAATFLSSLESALTT
ncbi:MAG TPA: protein kinase [Bryobacteraceae bacterium]|nr:protein kinase [Bryobacteraceae bacterium]